MIQIKKIIPTFSSYFLLKSVCDLFCLFGGAKMVQKSVQNGSCFKNSRNSAKNKLFSYFKRVQILRRNDKLIYIWYCFLSQRYLGWKHNEVRFKFPYSMFVNFNQNLNLLGFCEKLFFATYAVAYAKNTKKWDQSFPSLICAQSSRHYGIDYL